ncbi:MAG: hypothetical protein ACE148_13510 [Vicinamibacterales bacterium]
MIDPAYRAPAGVARAGKLALVAGLAALSLALVGAFADPRRFFHSYLLGYMLCLGVALGGLGLTMVANLTGGLWAVATRRVFEAASRTLPALLLLFVPLVFGTTRLYPWADPSVMASDELLQKKAAYLNVPFFYARAAIYFAVWGALAWAVNAWSARLDQASDEALRRRLKGVSAGGILLYVVTMTFAAFDWLMSLEPRWFSSIFGLLTVAGQGLAAIAFATFVTTRMAGHQVFRALLGRKVMLDVGNLMLAFTMLWAYMSFSQFLIIWSANLPEEAAFYVHRLHGGWQWVGLALAVFHFAVPFLALLLRATKGAPAIIGTVAAWMLLMRLVDLFWFIQPAASPERFSLHWLDVVTPAGLAGLWFAVFARQYGLRPVVPLPEIGSALEAAAERH